MKYRLFYNIFLMSFVLLVSTGCGGYHAKMYPGPNLEKSEISTITTDDQYVTIRGLDGKNTVDTSNPNDFANVLMWGRYPRTITVMPGLHAIKPCIQNPYESGCGDWIKIETEPGETYIVKHKYQKDSKNYYMWTEKQKESERTMHQKILGH